MESQSINSEIDIEKPVHERIREWSLIRRNDNSREEVVDDLPPAPDLDTFEEIHAQIHYQVPSTQNNDGEQMNISRQQGISVNTYNQKINYELGIFTKVLMESIINTFGCVILFVLGALLFNYLVEDEAIFVTNVKISDDSGLETEMVVEFFEDRTEISSESCYFTFCTDTRVVEESKSLHESICKDGKSSIPDYDCSQRLIREIDFDSSSYTVVVMLSFPWYFFGNYMSIREEKVRVYHPTKISAAILILAISAVSLSNIGSHWGVISSMLSSAVFLLGPGQAISWNTYPNLIYEAIFVLCLYYVFINESESTELDK